MSVSPDKVYALIVSLSPLGRSRAGMERHAVVRQLYIRPDFLEGRPSPRRVGWRITGYDIPRRYAFVLYLCAATLMSASIGPGTVYYAYVHYIPTISRLQAHI